MLHVCDEVMCLEPCPYPQCKGICNLPHDHAIVDDHSRCGCCEQHQEYVPEPVLAGKTAAADTAEDDDVAMSAGKGAGTFGSARAARMIAQKKLANKIGAAKASGQRPLKTKRAPAQESMASCCPPPGAAAGAFLDDQAAQPYYHGWGANVRKYGSHFQRYTNLAPVPILSCFVRVCACVRERDSSLTLVQFLFWRSWSAKEYGAPRTCASRGAPLSARSPSLSERIRAP